MLLFGCQVDREELEITVAREARAPNFSITETAVGAIPEVAGTLRPINDKMALARSGAQKGDPRSGWTKTTF